MGKTNPAAPRLVVGLISGTSMDGIDAALVHISDSPDSPKVKTLAFATRPYPAAVRRRVMHAAEGGALTTGELSELNFLLGEYFAKAATSVCQRAGVQTARLAAIGSHGQTVFHQGPGGRTAKFHPASTLQIGEPAVIAERTKARVVSDFRTADVAAGGHGAPLVPLVDYLLLRDAKIGAVALNIGGIANVTVIRAGARLQDVVGFDTGPGNMVMDSLARQASGGRMACDEGGRMARRGKVQQPLLRKILNLPFFRKAPPKSAGREQFGTDFLARYFSPSKRLPMEDLMATAAELTARSIAEALQRFVLRRHRVGRIIVSGGGAYNPFLMERLACLMPRLAVFTSDRFGLPIDAKEAIAFAVLADRTLHRLPGNLPRVTGAARAVVLGTVCAPQAGLKSLTFVPQVPQT